MICQDPEQVGQRAADLFLQLSQAALSCSDRFAVALSGGSTPESLYARLASRPFTSRLSWSRIHFFWGDERCVPPGHPDSNYGMAYERMLRRVPVPEENIHRIRAEERHARRAVVEYEQVLSKFFKVTGRGWPRFDLILLGLGTDGHTASLLPGTEALGETRRMVVTVHVEELQERRITLTAPVINHAANVVFLISGKTKAAALEKVIQGPRHPERWPAQLIRPATGRLVFIVDREAISLVAGSARTQLKAFPPSG